jgi:hypothetical protein
MGLYFNKVETIEICPRTVGAPTTAAIAQHLKVFLLGLLLFHCHCREKEKKVIFFPFFRLLLLRFPAEERRLFPVSRSFLLDDIAL